MYGLTFTVQEATRSTKAPAELVQYASIWCGWSRLALWTSSAGGPASKTCPVPLGSSMLIGEVGAESESRMDALMNILNFVAFIAINLAVMNLLPIPALDGGPHFLL